jgi:hypothetical protein
MGAKPPLVATGVSYKSIIVFRHHPGPGTYGTMKIVNGRPDYCRQ